MHPLSREVFTRNAASAIATDGPQHCTFAAREFAFYAQACGVRVTGPPEALMAEAKTGASPVMKWVIALILVLLAVYMYMRR